MSRFGKTEMIGLKLSDCLMFVLARCQQVSEHCCWFVFKTDQLNDQSILHFALKSIDDVSDTIVKATQVREDGEYDEMQERRFRGNPMSVDHCIQFGFPKAICCGGCVNFASGLMLEIDARATVLNYSLGNK